jgi:hypothetical protein
MRSSKGGWVLGAGKGGLGGCSKGGRAGGSNKRGGGWGVVGNTH